MLDLSDDELRNRWNMARCFAARMGFEYLAEDIAQDVMVTLLRGRRGARKRIDHAVVDVIRMRFGRSDRKSHAARMVIEQPESLDDVSPNLALSEPTVSIAALIWNVADDRLRFVLEAYLAGCTIDDIGFSLSVTPQRAWQLVKEGVVEIRRFYGTGS